MPLLGQASGGWTESSSALRILNLGIRNSIGVLTDDSFTQTNPCGQATFVSTRVDVSKTGVLSGSVAFVRPDAGTNHIGGAGSDATQLILRAAQRFELGFRPLGLFINSANGNPYENIPGVASGVGPYVCSHGTYGDALYETSILFAAVGASPAAGAAIIWYSGNELVASKNGFLYPKWQLSAGGVAVSADSTQACVESYVGKTGAAAADNQSTIIGVLKMVPDSVQTELVFDARL